MLASTPVPILLVDDKRENLLALAALLDELENLQIVQAGSAEEALRQLLTREFGLVLMDVQMPEMDGFEAATLIRANPKTRHVPIIFVTAHRAGSELEFRGYESGAVDYLVKPIEPLILQAKVQVFVSLYRQRLALAEHERYLAHVTELVAERTGHRLSQDQQLRVLLVDDRPENLVALEALLLELDEVVLVKANSGPDALRAVLRDEFAVILLDVQMPGMDGFETADLIRRNPKTRGMPIIFVTAGMKAGGSLTQGYQQGAVDYLIKPLEPAIVKSKVRVFCDMYRQRLAIEKHNTYLEILIADRTAALQRSATELAESGERHRRTAEKLELAARAAGMGIWDWNVQTNELIWDARMYELYGVQREHFGGAYAAWLAGVHPDERERCDLLVQRALRDEQPYDTEFRILRPDGMVRVLKANGQVVFDAHGQALRMTGVNYDITERMQAAEEVRRHRDNLLELVDERTLSLNAIVEHAADGIVSADQFGTILSFNAAAERMFGYPAQAVLGRNVKLLMPQPHDASHDGFMQRYRETGEAHIIGVGRELQGQRQDGTAFPLYLAVSEIRVAGQQRFTAIMRDISAQKALEAKLIQAREVAESANRAKSVFLSNMSHELRTPLNAVIGFSRLMSHAPSLSDDQRRNLEIINRSGNHLLTLINDVLELSKIEAGRMELLEQDVELQTLLGDVVDMLRARAEQSGMSLTLAASGLPVSVRVDVIKLRQVLINLLGNALKFTLQGGVRLDVAAHPLGPASVAVDFVVSDTGVGIEAENLEQIFEPFVQMRTHATTAGTGLGLTLSRQYVQLLGGALTAQSTPGKGSSFHFKLTLPTVELAAPGRASPHPVLGLSEADRGRRILIAEDDADSSLLLRELLEPLGFVVAEARDGVEALAQTEAFRPELIIMDWHMPRLDGLSATRQIRAQAQGHQPRIVMFSASALEEQRIETLAAGADEFMRKPLEELRLYAVLEQQLRLQFLRADGEPAPEGDTCVATLSELCAADLASLTQAQRQALRDSASEMSRGKLGQVLDALQAEQPALAARIARMADAFRYRELWQMLDDGADRGRPA